MRRRNNSGILIAIVALAVAIAYIFSSLFGGFGPGETGDGAPIEVNVGATVEIAAEPVVDAEITEAQTDEEVQAVEYVFNVPANDDIRYNGEAIDFAQYEALVDEAAARRATIRLIRDPSVSVEFGDRLRDVVNELNVEYVEE